MSDSGRRGRQGGIPEHITKMAEEFQRNMTPPYDSDDIVTAFECGFLKGLNSTDMTWQDIKLIVNIADEMLDNAEMRIVIQSHGEEAYYTEVLNKYKEEKK